MSFDWEGIEAVRVACSATAKRGLTTFCFVTLFSCLAGCNGGGAPNLTSQDVAEARVLSKTLSADELSVVKDSVAKILAAQGGLTLNNVSAVLLAGKPGTHVCGYAKPSSASGAAGEQPFYVELRQDKTSGAIVAHRGQVGSDPAKLAKVKFVCRHTGGQ